MEAVAKLRNVPTSPRKMRYVADSIRGKAVELALGSLKFQAKVGGKDVEKTLRSAISNWQQKNENSDLDGSNLYVKSIFVDCGKMLKRIQPAPQGRAHRVRKRSNHITIVVDTLNK